MRADRRSRRKRKRKPDESLDAEVRKLVREWLVQHNIDESAPGWAERLLRAMVCMEMGVRPDEPDWAESVLVERAIRDPSMREMDAAPGRPSHLYGDRLWRVIDAVLFALSGEESDAEAVAACDQSLVDKVISLFREQAGQAERKITKSGVRQILQGLALPNNPWFGANDHAMKSASERARAAWERRQNQRLALIHAMQTGVPL